MIGGTFKRKTSDSAEVKEKPSKPVGLQNKFKRMMTRVGAEAMVFALIIAGVFAVSYITANMVESVEKKQRETRASLQTVLSQTKRINDQVNDLDVAGQIYTELASRRDNMDFILNRDRVRPILTVLKERYQLTNLNLEFSPQTELTLPELDLVKGRPLRMDLTMNVGALADNYIYAFIDEYTDRFPGFVQLNGVTLQRLQPISIEVLSMISRGQPVETVSGLIQFTWFGYAPIEEPESEENANPQSEGDAQLNATAEQRVTAMHTPSGQLNGGAR